MNIMASWINEVYRLFSDFFSDSYNYIGFVGLLSGSLVAISMVLIYLFIKKKINPYRRAVRMYEKGNLEKSKILLRIELNKNPANRKALLLMADIECTMGDYQGAERDYYKLIDMKKPGDDIDVQVVRKKLLEPLYRQEKLSETLNMIRQILSLEKTDAIALYYLGLLYLSQLYYREAEVVFEKLIRNRPGMSQALFAYSVTLSQIHKFESSIKYMKRAIEIEENPVYTLCLAMVYYLIENFSASRDILANITSADRVYSLKQYLLFLRLDAFVDYMLGYYRDAKGKFKSLYDYYNRPEHNKIDKNFGLYDEFGRKKNISQAKHNEYTNQDSPFQDYFRIKEIAFEQNGSVLVKKNKELTSSAFLGIEGLTSQTWAALDYGFSMIKAGEIEEAHRLFLSLKETHPEVIGLKSFLQLISEKNETGRTNREYFYDISSSTEKVIARGKRKYELWEYIERWEKDSIRPYHLLIAGGFTTRKQLNPLLLYKAGRFFNRIG